MIAFPLLIVCGLIVFLFILVVMIVIYSSPRPIISLIARRFPSVLFFTKQPFNSDAHTKKLVALTIDDGLSPHTSSILDILSKHKARATFFLIGSHVNKYNFQKTRCSNSHHDSNNSSSDHLHFNSDSIILNNSTNELITHLHTHSSLLDRLVCEKMEIGNHMLFDQPSFKLSEEEFTDQLIETEKIIFQNQNQETMEVNNKVKCFRPGSGFFTQRMLSIVESNGYKTVLGDVYPFDPQIKLPKLNAHYILYKVKPGSIIILHDRPYTIQTLQEILPKLTERGFEITTVSDLLEKYDQ